MLIVLLPARLDQARQVACSRLTPPNINSGGVNGKNQRGSYSVHAPKQALTHKRAVVKLATGIVLVEKVVSGADTGPIQAN